MIPVNNVYISVPKEYAPFVSSLGIVSLLGSSKNISVPILRDTGASQSLILEGVLCFSRESANGEVMLQRVELGNISVQLRNIYLLCDLVLGLLIVEV